MLALRLWIFRVCFGALNLTLRPLVGLALATSRGVAYFSFTLFGYDRHTEDVFLAAYPESGHDYLQVLVHHLLRPDQDAYAHIDEVVPWFEVGAVAHPELLRQLPRPRIFKTRLRHGALPRSGRIVYAVRHPEAACTAYFRRVCEQYPAFKRLGADAFARRFARGKVPWGSWFRHFRSFWRHRHDDNLLILQYDDLEKDLPSCLERVREFLGAEITAAKRADILARCTPEYQRQHSHRYDLRLTVAPDPGRTKAEFIRRGKVGGHAEVLDPEQSQKIQREVDRLVKALGIQAGDPDTAFLVPEGSP
jgi:hypothetical protein